MRLRYGVAAILGVAAVLSGCSDDATSSAEPDDGGRSGAVAAVNYPLAFFAEVLLDGGRPVLFPVPADLDPAFWTPDPEEVGHFQQADLILLNGADYAKWVPKVSLSRRRLVDTSALFEKPLIKVLEATVHRHGPEGEHSHAGTASTTWLDFGQAELHAEAVHQALGGLLGEAARSDLDSRFESLRDALRELDQRMATVAQKVGATPLIVSHPEYQYWARRYGMNVTELEWEPGVLPPEPEWQRMEQLAGEGHQWMIWEAEPLEESVARLQSLGIRSLVFDPCGNRPATGDFLSVMQDNILGLEQAFK